MVQASFALARTQLAAGRVGAAMVIEPIATMMLKENAQYRMIFTKYLEKLPADATERGAWGDEP